MHRVVSAIILKAKKAHNCVAAVAHSLWYGKYDYNAAVPSGPSEILTLCKATVMPHLVLYCMYLLCLPLGSLSWKHFRRKLTVPFAETSEFLALIQLFWWMLEFFSFDAPNRSSYLSYASDSDPLQGQSGT